MGMPHAKLVEELAYILMQANPLLLFRLRWHLRNLTIEFLTLHSFSFHSTTQIVLSH